MAENSKIEWTTHTFNPWLGCTKVAAGCKHCYAEALMDTRYGKVEWGANGTRVLTSPSYWKQPLKWNREAAKAGVRARVFCASLADVFEEWTGPILNSKGERLCFYEPKRGYLCQAPYIEKPPVGARFATLDDIRRDLFALIDATPNLDWLLLTKRPENVLRMWPDCAVEPSKMPHSDGRSNVWLGTSIATQADADKNVPHLLKCRDLSPVLFVSAEPLIEKIDMRTGIYYTAVAPVARGTSLDGIDWLIIGGESGPHARPCNVAWIRSLKDQCAAAGVPCFVKQLGANRYDTLPTEPYPLKDAKGGDWSEWCSNLRVREFPKVTA